MNRQEKLKQDQYYTLKIGWDRLVKFCQKRIKTSSPKGQLYKLMESIIEINKNGIIGVFYYDKEINWLYADNEINCQLSKNRLIALVKLNRQEWEPIFYTMKDYLTFDSFFNVYDFHSDMIERRFELKQEGEK
jgi:hypothetical protein